MKPKHTPGPWHFCVSSYPERKVPPTYRGPSYYENPAIMSETGEYIVGCDEYDVFGPDGEERAANVLLLAAAPTLYAALERAVQSEALDKADDLLARAALAAADKGAP